MKDSLDRVAVLSKKLAELEALDINARLNNVTRRLIAEIVREQQTPMQLNYNLELKALRKLVDQQRDFLDE